MKLFGKVPVNGNYTKADVEAAAKNLNKPTKVVQEGDNWVVYILNVFKKK